MAIFLFDNAIIMIIIIKSQSELQNAI